MSHHLIGTIGHWEEGVDGVEFPRTDAPKAEDASQLGLHCVIENLVVGEVIDVSPELRCEQ